MKKEDVRKLFYEAKRRRLTGKRRKDDLFDAPLKTRGNCRTCGKVTWKPK